MRGVVQTTHLPVEDQYLEEGVHQQYPVGLYGAGVQQDGLGGPVEAVTVQDGLDHDQRLGEVLAHQHVPVEGRLVGRVVEHLEELRPPQVVHELGVQAEVLAQPERVRVVLVVLPELLTLKGHQFSTFSPKL